MARASDDRQGGRLRSAALAAGLNLLIGWALLAGLGVELPARPERPLSLFEVAPPAPPPAPEPARQTGIAREGEAAPPARRADPLPVAAPPPLVPPRDPPRPAAPVAAEGPAVAAGAAVLPGPGTGAGGAGDGLGGGGRGDGAGSGGAATGARLVAGRIANADYPRRARRARAEGAVTVRLDIDDRGRVARCAVHATSGDAELDAVTCRLIVKRFRYRPALDAAGRPTTDVRHWRQRWWLERD